MLLNIKTLERENRDGWFYTGDNGEIEGRMREM
jgi:long-subunit acyl-CoA synthetase (AMP-forming)